MQAKDALPISIIPHNAVGDVVPTVVASFNNAKQHVQEQGRTHMCISFRDTATSFTTRFWSTYWQQRLSCALTGTSAARVLRMVAADRLQADRIATGGKNVHTVAREYGRDGYDVPVAQSTNYSLETHPSGDDIATNMAKISTVLDCQASFGNATYVDEIWATICNLKYRSEC